MNKENRREGSRRTFLKQFGAMGVRAAIPGLDSGSTLEGKQSVEQLLEEAIVKGRIEEIKQRIAPFAPQEGMTQSQLIERMFNLFGVQGFASVFTNSPAIVDVGSQINFFSESPGGLDGVAAFLAPQAESEKILWYREASSSGEIRLSTFSVETLNQRGVNLYLDSPDLLNYTGKFSSNKITVSIPETKILEAFNNAPKDENDNIRFELTAVTPAELSLSSSGQAYLDAVQKLVPEGTDLSLVPTVRFLNEEATSPEDIWVYPAL